MGFYQDGVDGGDSCRSRKPAKVSKVAAKLERIIWFGGVIASIFAVAAVIREAAMLKRAMSNRGNEDD